MSGLLLQRCWPINYLAHVTGFWNQKLVRKMDRKRWTDRLARFVTRLVHIRLLSVGSIVLLGGKPEAGRPSFSRCQKMRLPLVPETNWCIWGGGNIHWHGWQHSCMRVNSVHFEHALQSLRTLNVVKLQNDDVKDEWLRYSVLPTAIILWNVTACES